MSEGKLKPRVMILAADPSDGLGHVTRLVGGVKGAVPYRS